MSKYTLVVLTNAVEGREEEFNAWYDDTHIPDVLRSRGFVSAQRFRIAETNPPQAFDHRYLALYDVETDDLDQFKRTLSELSGTQAMVISEWLDRSSSAAAYFEVLTDRVIADA
jgi:hypothetical protein